MKRLLYILPGPMPPDRDPKLSKLFGLSDKLQGDIFSPVWWTSKAEAEDAVGKGNFPNFKVGSFKYHFFLLSDYPKFLQTVSKITFYIYLGIRQRIEVGRYDYIMSYGTNSTGIIAVVLKYIHRAKYIAEISGVPENSALFDQPGVRKKFNVRQLIADLVLNVVVSNADHAKLLYETQLDKYARLKNIPKSVFHDFVATDIIESIEPIDDKFVLFMGFPWYLKGVDVLIKAFQKIKNLFPEHKLKCVGWFEDKKFIEKLAAGDSQIEIRKNVPIKEAYRLISSCSVFVLPSRTESMGRVLLEAMAVKKPIIGSDVNGIPTYVKDGENGILFPSEDIEALAEAIKKILEDPELAKEYGENGYRYLKCQLDVNAYNRKFMQMLCDIDSAK